jgi:hypothetical protein
MRTIFSTRLLLCAVLLVSILSVPAATHAQVRVGVAVTIVPPILPIYDQPLCPGDDYIWTPGYWDWDGSDYYWVPGTWVLAPEPGFFWTPGFWGWGDGGYFFTAGYWGPAVGFYGGINYGFGYFGVGYAGGRWENGHFFYNREVSNVNVTIIHNTYNETVVHNEVSRVSFNGGNGGITARPTPQEEAAARDRHIPPVAAQVQHAQAAQANRELHASVNHGAPPIAATPKPGAFNDREVVAAKSAGAEQPGGNAARPNTAVHPKDLPPAEHLPAPNTGNPKLDQKYQQQQNKLAQQQAQERQKLQQQQDKEHAQAAKQQANDAKNQQLEQKHQQQTQQLQQKHTQQTQQLQTRQQPHAAPAGRPH